MTAVDDRDGALAQHVQRAIGERRSAQVSSSIPIPSSDGDCATSARSRPIRPRCSKCWSITMPCDDPETRRELDHPVLRGRPGGAVGDHVARHRARARARAGEDRAAVVRVRDGVAQPRAGDHLREPGLVAPGQEDAGRVAERPARLRVVGLLPLVGSQPGDAADPETQEELAVGLGRRPRPATTRSRSPRRARRRRRRAARTGRGSPCRGCGPRRRRSPSPGPAPPSRRRRRRFRARPCREPWRAVFAARPEISRQRERVVVARVDGAASIRRRTISSIPSTTTRDSPSSGAVARSAVTPPSAARRRRRASGLNRRAAASAVRRASAARAVSASTPRMLRRPAWCIRGPNRIQSSIESIAGRRSGSRSSRDAAARGARRADPGAIDPPPVHGRHRQRRRGRGVARRVSAATAPQGLQVRPDELRSRVAPFHRTTSLVGARRRATGIMVVTGYVHLTGDGCNRSSGVPRCLGVSSRHGSGDRLRRERPRQRRHRRGTRRRSSWSSRSSRCTTTPRTGATPLPPRAVTLEDWLRRRGLPRGRDDPRRARPGRCACWRTSARPRSARPPRRPASGSTTAARRAGVSICFGLHRRPADPRERRRGRRRPRSAAGHRVPRPARRVVGPPPRVREPHVPRRSSGTGRRTVRAAGAR